MKQHVTKALAVAKHLGATLQRYTESTVLAWLYRSRPRVNWIEVMVNMKKGSLLTWKTKTEDN